METFSLLLVLCEGNQQANNQGSSDLRCHHTHYGITVILNNFLTDIQFLSQLYADYKLKFV